MQHRSLQSIQLFGARLTVDSVQVNLPAESGDMGVLANHVPSIEQLRPGLVEIVEEGGANKQFFGMSHPIPMNYRKASAGMISKAKNGGSLRWIRRRSAQLPAEYQRRRGFPS